MQIKYIVARTIFFSAIPCQVSEGCVHILSLLATSLIKNSGMIFICVKIMNDFISEEIDKLAV